MEPTRGYDICKVLGTNKMDYQKFSSNVCMIKEKQKVGKGQRVGNQAGLLVTD